MEYSKYQTISEEVKYKNPWWEYKIDKYILPSGNVGEYHIVNSKGSSFIIPLLDKSTFIMVRQYRYLNKKYSVEFPGGGVEDGLNFVHNAQKELIEESGYKADKLSEIGSFNPFNGVTNEICKVFLAENLKKANEKPEESEEIEVLYLNGNEINNMIIKGEIWDGMTLAAWSIYYFSKNGGKL